MTARTVCNAQSQVAGPPSKVLLVAPLVAPLVLGDPLELPPSYHLTATWKIGGSCGWDYLALDAVRARLLANRGDRVERRRHHRDGFDGASLSAPDLGSLNVYARAYDPLGTISSTDSDRTKKIPAVCHHR